jgi:hypothetical protein
MSSIRVVLPAPLRSLAQLAGEVDVTPVGAPTLHGVVDAIEAAYPMLRGTIRELQTRRRRAFVRFYACARDLSHDDMAAPLPPSVVARTEPLLIVGAMAGG